jgi:hypothetical protein
MKLPMKSHFLSQSINHKPVKFSKLGHLSPFPIHFPSISGKSSPPGPSAEVLRPRRERRERGTAAVGGGTAADEGALDAAIR